MLRRLAPYAFPFFLVGLEAVIREALKVDTSFFAGPALASGAAGLLVPHLSARERTDLFGEEVQKGFVANKVTVVGKQDQALAELVPLFLFACIGFWGWTIVLAERKDAVQWLGFQRSLLIGMACYVVALIIAEVKEHA